MKPEEEKSQKEILGFLKSHKSTKLWVEGCEKEYMMDVPMMVVDVIKDFSNQQLAERDKEIKEKDLLIKHWRNRFDHAESQLNDKTKSYGGILNWLEVTLSAESKLGASDEILNAYLTGKNYIQSLKEQEPSEACENHFISDDFKGTGATQSTCQFCGLKIE